MEYPHGVPSVILVDFNKVFVFGIVATQLVDFRQGVVVVPFLFALIERGTLVDGCHRVVLVASCVRLSFYCASLVLCDAAPISCDAAISFVTLPIRFIGIYHIPCDIAIIIVCYHTEVDKLKLKIN
jgi:hypothetical protein